MNNPSHLDAVLAELKKSRGIDFSGYRRSMLQRRLAARMARVRCDDPAAYLARLQTDPSECDHLIDAVAINVSAFFRNPIVWEILAQSVLPEIIERKRQAGDHEIRVWSAGCAAGEETVSTAIQIHRAFKGEMAGWQIHIFGTDIDTKALKTAADGTYPRESFADTKLGILDEYFTPVGCRYQIRPFLGKMVWFSRDDLTSPHGIAPQESVFGTFDLVLCRNVLIYFALELQDRVLDKLLGSLDNGGYLILGESDSLNREIQSSLAEVDGKNRIYVKHR